MSIKRLKELNETIRELESSYQDGVEIDKELLAEARADRQTLLLGMSPLEALPHFTRSDSIAATRPLETMQALAQKIDDLKSWVEGFSEGIDARFKAIEDK